MNQIDYKKADKYWNNIESEYISQYSLGYKIPEEKVAIYRFKKELCFLNSKGVFGGNYLDLGCGTGNFLFEWKNKFDRLIGIDLSEIMIQFAERKCKYIENIKIYKDTIINFKKYTDEIDIFSFVFIGGCLAYLNDEDVSSLIHRLFQRLDDGGVLIFREPIMTEERIFEDNKNYTIIRRTINEYKKLICLDKNGYTLNYYQNYAYNYAMIISFYWKIFPFVNNKITIFENPIIEFLFLFIPLKIRTLIKRNKGLNYFFIIKKKYD